MIFFFFSFSSISNDSFYSRNKCFVQDSQLKELKCRNKCFPNASCWVGPESKIYFFSRSFFHMFSWAVQMPVVAFWGKRSPSWLLGSRLSGHLTAPPRPEAASCREGGKRRGRAGRARRPCGELRRAPEGSSREGPGGAAPPLSPGEPPWCEGASPGSGAVR